MKFVVAGLSPVFDGEYPIDLGRFTMREFNIIKRIARVRVLELEEAFGAGDTDLLLALAVISVRRAGKPWEAFEALAWEAEAGKLELVLDDEEDDDTGAAGDAVPLIQPSGSGDSESSGEQQQPSGQPSSDAGDDPQETTLRAIGAQL